MRKLLVILSLFFFSHHSFGQYEPYLTVDYRNNLIGQVIDIYDGPQKLNKAQVLSLMSSDPEVYEVYKAALRKQRINLSLDIARTALFLGSTFYLIVPQPQSSQPSNVYLPLVLSALGIDIVAGFYRRSARNLTRQAVDLYNFGPPQNQSSPYFDGRIPQTKIFAYTFYF